MTIDRILSVVGIIIGVIVGWLFYALGNRSLHRHKQNIAGPLVVRDLILVLARGDTFTSQTVDRVIRDTLNELRYPLRTLRSQTIIADVSRQLNLNPFLVGEPRKAIEAQVEEVRDLIDRRLAKAQVERQSSGSFAAFITWIFITSGTITALIDKSPKGELEINSGLVGLGLLFGVVSAGIVYWIFQKIHD